MVWPNEMVMRVIQRVREEIAEANRILTEKHGIDPDNKEYKEFKYIMRYANDHGMEFLSARKEINRMRREAAAQKLVEKRHLKLVEKRHLKLTERRNQAKKKK